jgi:hypothetical protein
MNKTNNTTKLASDLEKEKEPALGLEHSHDAQQRESQNDQSQDGRF